MNSKVKWWINSIAAAIFVVLVIVYLIIRPVIVQNIGPVIAGAADNKINGTLTWQRLDLDPNYDLEFIQLELKDSNGTKVLSAPSLTVGWTLSSMYNYVMNDAGIASAVRTVTVEDPDIHVNQKADGTWNVQSLIKPSDTEDSGIFTGKVVIVGKNAKAQVTADQAGVFDFSGLSGAFQWNEEQVITGQMKGIYLDSGFDGTLTYTDGDHFDVHVKTDPLALKSLQPLINQFPQFSNTLNLQDGTGEVTNAQIWKSDGKVAYKIEGRLDHAALSYENYILADGAAFFCIENNRLTVKKFSGKINGQSIDGKGDIGLTDEDPFIRGGITLKKVDVSKLLVSSEYADAEGILDGQISLSGTRDKPAVDAELTVQGGKYKALEIPQGKIMFSYDDGNLQVPELDADAADGHVRGSGQYDVVSGRFSADVSLEHVDAAKIPWEQDVQGILSGTVHAEGAYGEQLKLGYASADLSAENLQYDNISAGHLNGFGLYSDGKWNIVANGRDLSYEGVSLDTASVSAYGEGTDAIHVSHMTGTRGGGSLIAQGDYAAHQMDFRFRSTDWDIRSLSGIIGKNVGGIISAEAKISGTPENPEGSLQFVFHDASLGNIAFDSGNGNASLQNRNIVIHSLQARNGEGSHSVSGSIGMDAPHKLSLKIRTDKTRIEDLMGLAGLDYPVTGWMANDLTITGDLENPFVQGDFRAWNGSVMGQIFQNISGIYSFKDNTVELRNILGYIYEGAAVVNGTVKKDALDLSVSLTDVNIERMLPDRGVKGFVSMSGKVQGTVDNPSFDGQAFSREIEIAGNKINIASAGIRYKDHMISLEDGTFRQKSGQFNWQGSYNTNSGNIQGNLQFSNWSIANIFQLFKLPGKSVDGEVEGGMRISGTLDSPNVDFKAKVSSGHLGSAALGEGTIDFSYRNKALLIRKMYIPVGEGSFAAEGSMNSAGDLDIQAAARNMDISWIPSVLGRDDISIGGNMTALVQLSGNRNMPRAQTSVEVLKPRYGDILFDQVLFMAAAENNVITVRNATISRNEYKATAKGTLPGNVVTGSTTDKAVPLDIDVNLDQADMNIFALFFKEVTSADGPIKGHLKIGGSYTNPYLLGGISVNNGGVTLAGLNEPVSDIQMNVGFNGYTADLKGSAQLGGGGINTQGMVSWEQFPLYRYTGELHIHAPHIRSSYYEGALDGDFILDQLSDRPGIRGNLHIHDTTIDIPLALFSNSEQGLPDLMTRIDIQVGDNVRLYNSALYDMMLKGNISLAGPMSAPILDGRVNVLKGTVKVNTTEFKIDQASATWNGLPGNFLPIVHAQAVSKVGHYNISAEMDGMPGSMRTRFHSEPPLSDTQILLLLTIHQNPEQEASGAMEGALFNAGLTMILGNGIQDFLQDKIGLDLISITSNLTDYYSSSVNENDNYYYMKIGKYLFNDFMLTATMGVNNDDKSVGIHYDLNSHLGLSSWYNNRHDSYVGTDWSFKF